MYFNFTIRLLELEGVSSDTYQQVARENCGCVIIKNIVMRLEITQLRCEDIVTYKL